MPAADLTTARTAAGTAELAADRATADLAAELTGVLAAELDQAAASTALLPTTGRFPAGHEQGYRCSCKGAHATRCHKHNHRRN